MSAPLVFLDTETTGLGADDEIWEVGAYRRDPDGSARALHMFVAHDTAKCAALPASFLADHRERFPRSKTGYWHPDVVMPEDAAKLIVEFMAVDKGADKPHVVGAVPSFESGDRLFKTGVVERLLLTHGYEPPWHYHLIDVEAMAVGFMAGRDAEGEGRPIGAGSPFVPPLPWNSNDLSRAIGVEPPGEGERHTALGDARWAMRMYDAMTGGS